MLPSSGLLKTEGQLRVRRPEKYRKALSRREFLDRVRWGSALLLPSSFTAGMGFLPSARVAEPRPGFGEVSHLIPHYPAPSPLDAMIGLVVPGSDGYAGEKIAAELQSVLGRWSSALKNSPIDLRAIKESLAPSFECNFAQAPVETKRRSSPSFDFSARVWAA